MDPWPTITVVIRGRVPPQRLAGALREAVTSIDAEQALAHVSTMEERIAGLPAPRRFTMTLLGIAAATALALALVGIYGMVAHSVAQRRHELGIRLALGAQPRRLVESVVASALGPVGTGVAAGVALALVVTQAMSALVFGAATNDLATFVAIALLAAGAAAGELARRPKGGARECDGRPPSELRPTTGDISQARISPSRGGIGGTLGRMRALRSGSSSPPGPAGLSSPCLRPAPPARARGTGGTCPTTSASRSGAR